ncbi:MAG: GxxExxY protein [Pyrinomonadaceae bacterium]
MDDLLYRDEVYAIIGAAVEVHKELGKGFLEPVYQEALEIEFSMRKVPFVSQERLRLFYKGVELKKEYIPDFLCFGQIIVEIKAIDRLTNIEIAQLINYLKATKLRLGLLINFGSSGRLEWKRFVV